MLIGVEHRPAHPTKRLPDEAVISVVSPAGSHSRPLHTGRLRSVRIGGHRRLQMTGSTDVAPPVDGVVATASLTWWQSCSTPAAVRASRRRWIATTARAHDVAACTSRSDFEELPIRVATV